MGIEIFGKKGIVVAMLSLLIISMSIGIVYAAPQVDESTPIGMKWVKLGGAAVVGYPTSEVLMTPNGAAQYQKFEKGVIVYSENWGAIFISSAIFDKWFSLQGQTNTEGQDLFNYIGVPIKDFTTATTSESGIFEHGMIVVRPASGTAFVISGEIYLHYWDAKDDVGLPTSEQSAVAGGWHQSFENGEIYWKQGIGAFAVQGAIRQRWLDLGGPGGSLGFPLSDEKPVVNASIPGQINHFENGNIYYSKSTGAWEVTGEILKAYEKQYGGPAGWLGFPISGQGSTPTSSGIFNDFQNGVIVSHSSGAYPGTYAFNQLNLHLQRIAGFSTDCIFGICGSTDTYVNLKVTTPAGLIVDARRPDDGDCAECDFDDNWILAQPVHSNLTINVWVEAWDADDTSSDDPLGTVSMDYNIDNLWGIYDNPEHGGSSDEGSFKVWFSTMNSYPFNATNFTDSLFWSFHNFNTTELSYDQYAYTFTDVDTDDVWWRNPFNVLYYEIAYKGIASNGNCFGMDLESVNAQKGKSMYGEPIFQYFSDTQTGAWLTDQNPLDDAHKSLINEINIKQGYQLGASEIDHWLREEVTGNHHNPKHVFTESKAAFERGDDPTISITNDFLFGGGHNVRPYKWDNTTNPWRIYIADSNNPAGASSYTQSYIEIDPNSNCYKVTGGVHYKQEYSGCEWSGGRMFYYPYHVMDESPQTPFWEVFDLLSDGDLVLVGDTGQTNQITDDAGHSFYKPGLSGPPTRWDQISNGTSKIPNLARIALSDADSGGNQAEIYYGKGEGTTYRYEILPKKDVAAGTPYEWLFNSGLLSTNLTIPGTPNVPDVITVRQIETSNKAVSLSIPADGEAKEVAWTISGGVKGRWSKLTKLKMIPSQSIEIRLKNGGYNLEFNNSGPTTTAELEVQADPGATPVTVGEINITNGTTNFEFGAPLTTLNYSGGKPGKDGWLLTPINVTLQAFDYSGTGIDYIEYSLNGTTWIRYSGPFIYAEEGVTTLYYRAKDRAGNQEAVKNQSFKIDTHPPVVNVTVDKPSYTRVEPFIVHYSAYDPMPGSGLESLTATLDGIAVTNGQSINLLWYSLGTHTLTATATDVASWNTTQSASFEIVATLESLKATITELRRLGEIDNDGIEQSLLAKVDAATASQQQGHKQAALNQLQALLNEIGAQTDKKHITQRAADLLNADVRYVMAHLP